MKNTRSSPARSVRYVLSFVVWVGGTAAFALKAQAPRVIAATDHRPMAAGLDELEKATGVAINYEDVPYEHESDLEDVSTAQQRAWDPSYRLMVPRRGSVSVTLRAVESVGDQLAHINELVNSYRSNKLPGDFKVEQANGMYYVVPVKTMSQNGAFRDVVSPLLVPVSFPYAERRLIGTVALILEGVSKSGGPRIDVGALPFNPAEAVAFSAKREPARDALARLFAKTTVKPVSCRLLFDPVFKYYMLNVQAQSESHSMAPPVENTPAVEPPTGARKLQPGENQWADRAQK